MPGMALILVAEDDQFFSSLIARRLQEHGFGIICAFDGEETISLARSKHPDLLLLDLLMPKKDGYSVMEELRADADTAKIPILIATNLSDRDSIERGMKLGAVDALIKADTTPEEIAQRISALLKK